jgi:sporulation and cell division protein SsgA
MPIITRVTMEGFDETGSRAQTEGMLSYDPTDPFAVTLTLKTNPRDVRWTFARDLLVDGLSEPAGAGDVVLFPALDAETGFAVNVIELRSRDGYFMAQMPRQALQSFVRAMLDSVPLGAESELLDLDRLAALLAAPRK